MLKNINFHNGKIIYNSFNIDLKLPLKDQIYDLSEDLLQIEYGDHYFIDVGWYPLLNPNGYFLIRIIKKDDWLNPIYIKKISAHEIQLFPQALEDAARIAHQLDIKNN